MPHATSWRLAPTVAIAPPLRSSAPATHAVTPFELRRHMDSLSTPSADGGSKTARRERRARCAGYSGVATVALAGPSPRANALLSPLSTSVRPAIAGLKHRYVSSHTAPPPAARMPPGPRKLRRSRFCQGVAFGVRWSTAASCTSAHKSYASQHTGVVRCSASLCARSPSWHDRQQTRGSATAAGVQHC